MQSFVHYSSKLVFLQNTMSMCSETFSQLDKVRILQIQTIVFKSHRLLFPFDHTIRMIIEYHDNHIKLESNSCFYISQIHNQSSISHDTNHFLIRIKHLSNHSHAISSTHSSQCVIKQDSVWCIGRIISRYPDLVKAIVQCNDIFCFKHTSQHTSQSSRHHHRRRFFLLVRLYKLLSHVRHSIIYITKIPHRRI